MNLEEDINEAVSVLRNGGVILYPTDTIWGLGCDATNPAAVEKIFRIKSRSESKNLLILVDGIQMIERYVKEIPEIAYELTSVSDDPITIIYPSGKNLAPGVCSEDGSAGIRISNDEFCRKMIGKFKKPVVSTSANLSGAPSPACFSEIDRKVIESADYVVSHRRDDNTRRKASAVIKLGSDGALRIIRK
jgi:L-threonylcarbamoyladenylate synthase